MKYLLKCISTDNKTKFVTSKSGKRNSNIYYAIDLVYGEEIKVTYGWVKENIEKIANAEVCGSKLYHKIPTITFDKDIHNHIHNSEKIVEIIKDNIIKSNSLLSNLLESNCKMY